MAVRSGEQVVYRPWRNRLTLLFENSIEVFVATLFAGALASRLAVGLAIATVVVLPVLWVTAILRTKVVVTHRTLIITNRWRTHTVQRWDIERLETRPSSGGIFSGRSVPAVAAIVEPDSQVIRIEISASFWRQEREELVALIGKAGDTPRLNEYLEFTRGRQRAR